MAYNPLANHTGGMVFLIQVMQNGLMISTLGMIPRLRHSKNIFNHHYPLESIFSSL